MKILVLSDSHSSLYYMKRYAEAVKPQAIVHLGDHYDDADALAELYPHIPVHRVPGNCDTWRMTRYEPPVKCYDVCGVRLLMTHGHEQGVKQTRLLLVKQAREQGAAAALYGHTHIPDCHREEDGLWVLNPGSCGCGTATAGLIETENGSILSMRILHREDLQTLYIGNVGLTP